MYDIKIYEENEEKETIRDLNYAQMCILKAVFERNNIKHFIKEISSNNKKDNERTLELIRKIMEKERHK